MTENKWTKPNRQTEIIRHVVSPEIVGSAPGYSMKMLSTLGDEFAKLKDGDTVWFVWRTTRTGLDKEQISVTPFASEEAANNAVSSAPVGTILDGERGFEVRFRDFLGASTDGQATRLIEMMFGAGDQEAVHFKCYEALAEAGVVSKSSYQISEEVLQWIGEEDARLMELEFGENWTAVAELEFCLNHFAYTSLATLAARLFVAQFVTYDDFAAGYLTKEIEVICGGTEQAAVQSTETKKKAGQAGGTRIKSKASQDLEFLMSEIEDLKPAVGLMSEERIIAQAKETARAKFPSMPTSKSSLDDYVTALRTEKPFKARYSAVFAKNP